MSSKKASSKADCLNETDENDEGKFPFPVGTLVTVESRTWPGINEPGGPGKVVRSYKDSDGVDRVDVKYVLRGQTEKNIEIIFVSKQSYLEKKRNRRRPTNMNIGHKDSHKQKNVKKKSCKDGKEVIENKTNENKKRKGNGNVKSNRCIKKVRTNLAIVKKNHNSQPNPTNETDEESLENSIPREITIVSCTTSVASLSFYENNPTIITNDESQKSQRKNHHQKKLSIAAKSNRKLTEYFPRSPYLPLGLAPNMKISNNQYVTEKVTRTSKSKEKSISLTNHKLKIHEDHKMNSFNIVRNENKFRESKAKQKMKQPLKESSNIMMTSREKKQCNSTTTELGPRPNSILNETPNLPSTPRQEPIAKPLPKPKPVDNAPK